MTDQSNMIDGASDVTVRCGQCGSVNLIESIRDDMFAYGSGKDAVELTVPVPVYSCSQCGLTFTTERAEILRHEAVCRHLGVLSPAQIRDIRTRANLTRERFAALTGIGTASLARWETGELIQSAGYDKYLRLLAFAGNLERLRHWATEGGSVTISSIVRIESHRKAGPFKALIAAGRLEERSNAASSFSLRLISGERIH